MIAVVSPELQRVASSVKSAYNAASLQVHGIEPQYQAIRTIDIEQGRGFRFSRRRAGAARGDHRGRCHEAAVRRVATAIGQRVYLNGLPYTVIGRIRKKDQDSNYSGPDNDKVFVPFCGDRARLSAVRCAAPAWCPTSSSPRSRTSWPDSRRARQRTGRIEDIDWPLEREVRRMLSRVTASTRRIATPSRCGTRRLQR